MTQVNNSQSTASTMDAASLYTRDQPLDLYTFSYNGILSPQFFVEGRVSARHLSFVGSGSQFTDIIKGTLLQDRQRGGRYWAPTFCGVCIQKRDNDNENVKATHFKSTGLWLAPDGLRLRHVQRQAVRQQPSVGQRLPHNGTTSIIREPSGCGDLPAVEPGRVHDPPAQPDCDQQPGHELPTHSIFYNDQWRFTSRLTFNLGIRYDKNHGADSAGNVVANDSAVSPRLGVVWDPSGDGKWSVYGSLSKYVAALNNSIADSSSAAGNPATLQWTYSGPPINPDPNAAVLVDSATAISQMFAWCAPDSRGYCTVAAPSGSSLPVVSVRVAGLSVTF